MATTALTELSLAFDVVLAAALAGCAAVVVLADDAFEATALFIVFGVLMAVAWTRLGAVDVALAEVAISAGITGALLLHAQGWESAGDGGASAYPGPRAAERRPGVRWGAGLAAAAAAAGLGTALFEAPAELPGLAPLVAPRLAAAGADNPVTAVLLNVRAYDTFLELAVLLAAVVAVWGLALPPPPSPPQSGLLLRSVARLITPVSVLIGGYLLWQGTTGPGGAFQAGAVIAGAAILCALAGGERPPWAGPRLLRAALVAGILAFLAAGSYGLARGEPFLWYRRGAAKAWILAIEIPATLSIALALVAVFVGRPPRGPTGRRS